MLETPIFDYQRRFGGLERLYGDHVLTRLARAHVLVAGLGGVGTWCAEALARSGVGVLTLVDMDHIAESNVNRQLHATTSTLGQSKVLAMTERILGINPQCVVHIVDDFVTTENVGDLLAGTPDVVIDCTDQVQAKIAMVLEGRRRGIPVLVCGGAGGKTNPLALRAGDLARASHDALLGRMRNLLRRRHGFPRPATAPGKARRLAPRMGVNALWFEQEAILPTQWRNPIAVAEFVEAQDASGISVPGKPAVTDTLQGLSCAGYGSVVTITATMGMAAANHALALVTGAP